MTKFKRGQAKYVKHTRRISSWPAYDQALGNRGSLTFWFAEDAISKWASPAVGKLGGQPKYSNLAIQTVLAFRMVFHLAWRQTRGCLQSLVEIHGLTLDIPHHRTFSRRAKGFGKVACRKPSDERRICILVDGTGIEVHSGNMRKHPKNRAWRKIHLIIDANTGDVVACDLGSSKARGAVRVPSLLKQIECLLASVTADSARQGNEMIEAPSASRRSGTLGLFGTGQF